MTTTAPPVSNTGGAVVSLVKPPIRKDEDEELSLSPIRFWRPNQEPDTLLKCGCLIPWPIIVLLGSGHQVQCDLHGWQHVQEKEKRRARKATKQWENTAQAILTDPPPF